MTYTLLIHKQEEYREHSTGNEFRFDLTIQIARVDPVSIAVVGSAIRLNFARRRRKALRDGIQ